MEVVVDHQPLVSLYNNNRSSDSMPERVSRHKNKLTSYDFKVVYESGKTTPSDYGSRHPPPREKLSREKKEELGIEGEEEDTEVLINNLEEMNEAVTIDIIQNETNNDGELKQLIKDVTAGRMSTQTKKGKYKEVYGSLSVKKNCLMRGQQIVIPTTLRPDVLSLGHEGHPGADSMLSLLRQTCWWPNMGKDVREYCKSCNVGCAAANPHTQQPPTGTKPPPGRVGKEMSADFKGPIGGKYYLHTTMDNYSRWPEVVVVESTAFSKLKPHLERTFEFIGILKIFTRTMDHPATVMSLGDLPKLMASRIDW